MRPFAVFYKDLNRWDVKNFIKLKWYWNKDYITRISEVIRRKKVLYSSDISIQMLSIHFDGSMSERPLKKIKGTIFAANTGDLVYSKIDLRNGAIGIIPDQYPAVGFTSEFPIYEVSENKIKRDFINLIFHNEIFKSYMNGLASGTSGRKRIDPEELESIEIPIPPLHVQEKIVDFWKNAQQRADELKILIEEKEKEIKDFIFSDLGIEKNKSAIKKGSFIINFKDLDRWSFQAILLKKEMQSTKFALISLSDDNSMYSFITRGKSPKYSDDSSHIVLNQKCNRWNHIDLSYARKVDENWLKGIDKIFLTREGDILINSTGEGTLGRASFVSKNFENLFYDSHMLLLRLNIDKINPRYFVEVFNSNFIQKQIEINKSAKSTKQTELGIDNLKNIFFPLPPLESQLELIEKIEKLRKDIKSMKEKAIQIIGLSKKELELIIIGKKSIEDIDDYK